MGAAALLLLVSSLLFACGAHQAQLRPHLELGSRLVHRFSDEARAALGSAGARWPARGTAEYYRALARRDHLHHHRRRRLVAGRLHTLVPAEGPDTFALGNDFGWLHYMWIDIGTPNVSFLVALDAGSDLFWVPCDCIQCAPLSDYRSSSDKNLGMYRPAESRTSRHLNCSHKLCGLGPSCKGPKQPCPYTVDYYSENTSSSGFLVEDKVYLATSDNAASVQASVIVGCGRKQSGGYLDGIAPDGLLGLGFGDISVPSMLAKAGLVRNSFSMCFNEDDSGRLFFGDLGVSNQQSTPFITSDGQYVTYIVEVEKFCIGAHCLGKTSFQALVDSGSSFTFIPGDVYKRITLEFHKQVNASRLDNDEAAPWEYCYEASPLQMPEIPSVILIFAVNKSFIASNPIFLLYGKEGELAGFCLALQSSEESMGNLGIIGQNFMTGYHMVFDRENLKLAWSPSNCQDLGNSSKVPLTPPPVPHSRHAIPLPSDEQQNPPTGHAAPPGFALKTPTPNSSAASPPVVVGLYLSLFVLAGITLIFAG